MKKIVQYKSVFWKTIVGVLGFSICWACSKYGEPDAEYIIKGEVVSSDEEKAISGIKASLRHQRGSQKNVITDKNGSFTFMEYPSTEQVDSFYIKFTDIDSTENREFQEKEIQVIFNSSASGVTNENDLGKIKLQPKQKEE